MSGWRPDARVRSAADWLRRGCRKVARTYALLCAREDAKRWQLVIPAGVWFCQRCPHVTFDIARLREHYLFAHAY
jgi:hypothetical protein